MRRSNDFYRKCQHKQNDNSITAKLKMKFRYSPSFQTQKCHSKLPSRFNYNRQSKQTHKRNQHNLYNQHIPNTEQNKKHQVNPYNQIKNNQIDCQYSSVKQKLMQNNQCNDTSSWIAKLVYGIQDQDQKNIHKLSQIQARSISDLPEDSHDYADNQFLALQGHKLFPQNNINTIPNNNIISTITNNNISTINKNKHPNQTYKKSTKLDKIDIKLKQNYDGLKGPPATRVNSCTKRQTQKSLKVIKQDQKKQVKKALPVRIRQQRKNENLLDLIESTQNKRKDEIMNKNSLIKNKINKSVQSYKINIQTKNDRKKDCSTNTTLLSQYKFKKIGKKLTYIQVDSHAPTRKNSLYYCSRQQISNDIKESQPYQPYQPYQQENKSQVKSLKRPNLFTQNCEKQINITKQASSNKILDSFQSTPVELTFQSSKKIGGIKKNIIRKQKQQIMQTKQVVNLSSKSPILISSIQLIKQKQNYLPEINKQAISIKATNMNQSTQQQLKISIDIQQSALTSFRQNLDTQTTQRIKALFNKIKLDPTNNILSKNNLKLRILNVQEKEQIGTIIAKIHYQNYQYDFNMFQEHYRQANSLCTLKGCFSKYKLNQNHVTSQKEMPSQKNMTSQKQMPSQKELSFYKENQKQIIVNLSVGKINNSNKEKNSQNVNLQKFNASHQRKASNLIKRNLFDKDKQTLSDKINKICKNPYIQQSTLSQIDIHSTRQNKITQIGGKYTHCVIEKLNDKLNTYIDKNNLATTYRQFNLNFSELKKHIR